MKTTKIRNWVPERDDTGRINRLWWAGDQTLRIKTKAEILEQCDRILQKALKMGCAHRPMVYKVLLIRRRNA